MEKPLKPPPQAEPEFVSYTVGAGDTLYSIARWFGYDYLTVAAWNDIPPPYTIYVGQAIKIYRAAPPPTPDAPATDAHIPAPISQPDSPRIADRVAPQGPPLIGEGASPPAPPAPSAPPPATPPKLSPEPSAPRKPPLAATRKPRVEASAKKQLKVSWQWPLNGIIAKTFSQTGNKGIDIAAPSGHPVLAAASGKVVYVGSGLIGYGKLVIVKHGNEWLTAYGNNRRLLVKEGQEVKAGQKIAEVGALGGKKPALHFEIRKNGKPVDPADYLPSH